MTDATVTLDGGAAPAATGSATPDALSAGPQTDTGGTGLMHQDGGAAPVVGGQDGALAAATSDAGDPPLGGGVHAR